MGFASTRPPFRRLKDGLKGQEPRLTQAVRKTPFVLVQAIQL